jgi:hypothetical protein
MDKGKEKAWRRQPSPISRAAPERDRALPGKGEPEASAVALGGDAGVLGMQMSRNMGKRGGVGLFNWQGGLGDRHSWSWSTGLALAGMGGVVAGRCPGVRGAWSFGGMRVSSGAGTDALVVQSCHRAGVRRLWWQSNGRESRGGCASRVLVWHGVCVLE